MPFFEVSEATEADIPRLMEVQFSAFEGDPVYYALYGGNTVEARATEGENTLKLWRKDLHQVRLVKATNTSTGEIVAFGRWRFYETERLESEWRKPRAPVDWCEGRRKEIAENLFGVFGDWQDRTFGGMPYILLAFLSTHKDHQRQGAGEAIVKWGLGQGDQLGIPVYLEASKAGRPLYEKLGFRALGEIIVEKEIWYGDHDRHYMRMVKGKLPGESD